MKKIAKYSLLSTLILVPCTTILTTAHLVVRTDKEQKIATSFHNNENKLKPIDLFKYWKKTPKNAPQKIKDKIHEVVTKYRLVEWNEYYQKSENLKIKANVLEPAWTHYNLDVTKKLKRNKVFKNDIEDYYTNIYLNQDEQFRYFNNIINLLNEENNEKQPDFLYLRWLYYSYFAADKYHNIMYHGKPIYDVKLSDWVQAISIAIASVGTKTDDLQNLIKAYLSYYGISGDGLDGLMGDVMPDFSKSKTVEKKKNIPFALELNLIDKSIFQAYLCSKDMAMRYSTIPDYDLEHYQLLKKKALRAKEVNQLMNKYYSILVNIFDEEINEEDMKIDESIVKPPEGGFQPVSLDALKGVLDQIKKALMTIIDQIGNLVSLKKREYLKIK